MDEKKQKSFAVHNKRTTSAHIGRYWHCRTLGVLTQLYKTVKPVEEVMSSVDLSPSTLNQRNTVY